MTPKYSGFDDPISDLTGTVPETVHVSGTVPETVNLKTSLSFFRSMFV